MKNITILFALLIALSSCGRLKKTQETSTAKVDSTSTSQTNETITVEERIDTVIQIVERVDSVVKYISTTDTVFIDNEVQRVVVVVDTITKKVYVKATVKERFIPVQKIKKTITERESKQSNSIKSKTVEKSKVKVKSTIAWWWWLIGAIVLSAYIYLKYFSPLRIVRKAKTPP